MSVLYSDTQPPFMVDGFPAPVPGRIEPLNCVRAVRRLLANKEDTTQVFEIMRTLLGDSHVTGFKRFNRTPLGQKVLLEKRNLIDALKDRNALAVMAPGSLGRLYHDWFFLEEGLMIEMLEGASADLDRRADQNPEKYPDFMRYVHRMRYCHDLWHLLPSYGRDGLGEACNVAFSYSQTKIKGFAAIAWFAGMKWKKEAPKYPVIAAVREAFELGKQARWLPGEDIESLLPMQIEEVRAKLRIGRPEIYLSIPKDVLDSFGKPEDERREKSDADKAA